MLNSPKYDPSFCPFREDVNKVNGSVLIVKLPMPYSAKAAKAIHLLPVGAVIMILIAFANKPKEYQNFR